jgi:hypothetical protein
MRTGYGFSAEISAVKMMRRLLGAEESILLELYFPGIRGGSPASENERGLSLLRHDGTGYWR